MKKSKILLPLALLGLVFGMAACNTNNGGQQGGEQQSEQQQSQTPVETDPAKQVKINITAEGDKTKLIYPDTVQLSADQEGVMWESAKPEIATVSETGLVTAVSKGSAAIKAIKEGFKDGSISISVNYPDITVTASGEKDILVGGKVTLTASEQGVTWSSSDPEVATVENGVVTGLKLGSATIKASKEHFNDGSVTINVIRPAVSAQLDLVIASDHYSADGWWELPAAGGFGFAMQEVAGWNPTANAVSWGQEEGAPVETFIGGFGIGDKETVKFTASKAVKAELVLNIGNSDEVALGSIMSAKLNNVAIDLSQVTLPAHAGDWGNSLAFDDLSLGELNLVAGENTVEFEFLTETNIFLNELRLYAGDATVTLVPPAAKEQITVTNDKLEVVEGETVQIETAVAGVSYAPVDVEYVSVNESGLVTGLKVGKTNVTVKKDGMYSARVEITVNPKPVAGQIIVEAEDGEEVATEWGSSAYMRQEDGSGMGGGNAVHSGGAYVSFFSMGGDADLTLTIKFEATEAKKMVLSVVGNAPASWQGEGSPYVFAESAELSFNGTALTFTDQAFPAASGMSPEMVEIVLGEVDVIVGENVIVFHTVGAAPALDCFKLSVKE